MCTVRSLIVDSTLTGSYEEMRVVAGKAEQIEDDAHPSYT